MKPDEITKYILDMPDEVLRTMKFAMPWQYDSGVESGKDEDGFPTSMLLLKRGEEPNIYDLQQHCFEKFGRNPYVNTAIRGHVGRIVGMGFGTTSEIFDIQKEVDETENDPRNRLYYWWPKYLTRFNIEGELFLGLTLHDDGFVEIDFFDPATLKGGGDSGCGIFYHPNKPQMPLLYYIQNGTDKKIIPSIFIARYPDLMELVTQDNSYRPSLLSSSRARGKSFKKIGGFKRFIIGMDKGFVTRRAVSYLRTTIEWLNHYENLKKYEIDHKKSSGAYLWIFSFDDIRAFKTWLTLSEDEKRKTGIGSKITPGSRIVLPPGMKCEAMNPNLTAIKDQDTDILHMISGGLNEPEDVMSGAAKGTFASVKASRGPMSDRISDEIAYFKRWYINDFWGSIFFLKSAIGTIKPTYKIKEAVDFNDSQEPVYKKVDRKPEELISVSFPISEALDYEKRTGAILGVKHGPMGESLGIPNSVLAEMLGFSGYGRYRLRKATEDDRYPELIYAGGVDTLAAESTQEKVEGEPGKPKPAAGTQKKQMVVRKPKEGK